MTLSYLWYVASVKPIVLRYVDDENDIAFRWSIMNRNTAKLHIYTYKHAHTLVCQQCNTGMYKSNFVRDSTELVRSVLHDIVK